jgi:4-nitrophenyl phosphatase
MNAAVQTETLEPLPSSKAFVFDLDGTLLLSDRSLGAYEVLPGAIEVLTTFKDRGIPVPTDFRGSQ